MAYELEDEMEALPELEDELEDEGELEYEDELEDEAGEGEGWLGTIGNIASSLLGEEEGEGELEDEYEDEYEDELEGELSPIRKIYSDAMMEHLGELAAEAETEDEAAEHFLPLIGMAASKLLPMAAKAIAPAARRLVPKIARAVTRATPHLTRGIAKVARTLHRSPHARHLLKVVPRIARRTVGTIARQAAHGRHVTPRTAVRTLARQARHVLAHPHHRRNALRHHHRLERRFHHHFGKAAAHPRFGYRYGRRWRGVPGHAAVPGRAGVPVHYGRHVHHGHLHGVRPGVAVTHAVHGTRAGRIVGGRCTCGPCPSCGAPATHSAAPTPNYCRCCGQIIR